MLQISHVLLHNKSIAEFCHRFACIMAVEDKNTWGGTKRFAQKIYVHSSKN